MSQEPVENPKSHIDNLAASCYQQDIKIADKLLTELTKLPFTIDEQYRYAVVGHIQHFGWTKVYRWAQRASDKREPQRYFMRILSSERYA